MRELQKTEDPNGSVITIDTPTSDCGSEDRRRICLWSADFALLATWCFTCKQFHETKSA